MAMEAPIAYYLIFILAAAAVIGLVALDIKAKQSVDNEKIRAK
jgi:hypothetical protein